MTRFIICERCGGDGGFSVETSFNPFTGRIGYTDIECEACGGEGQIEVEEDEPEDLE